MSFEKIFRKVIEHDCVSDQQKRTFILKALQHIGKKNTTYEEAFPVFEICLPMALENHGSKAAVLPLFAFATWGNKFPAYLAEFLTEETITDALDENDSSKLKIVLMWLKEGLQILQNNDSDYVLSISPILSGVLENKFLENGKHSGILSLISELYLLCPSLLPLQHVRLKFTISILHCVASFPTPTKPETLKHMKNLGDLITKLWETLQLEDILSTLIAMYSIISNPDTSVEVCPAMAHILSLVFPQVVEGLGPRIVSDPQSSNDSFVATLIRLCSWLITWPTAHITLVHWIRTLVRLLCQSGRNIVPARITYDQVPKLLEGLRIPVCRPGVLSVVSILLMSFQYSNVAFHKVIPVIISMMECLENEKSNSAIETLQELVKLCHAQMALYPGHPDTYQSLMDILIKYPTPSDEDIQSLIQEHNWVATFNDGLRFHNSSKSLSKLLGPSSHYSSLAYYKRAPGQKVGLRNLGNTCYMNSVIQALFMTDDFRHSVLHTYPKQNQHLLGKLQHLFTSLCFSHRSHVSPKTFHDTSRPPWFSPGMQHDCSEYLRHLMITLHEEERSGQKLPEYQERMIIESETTSLASDLQQLPEDNYQTQMHDGVVVECPDHLKLCSKYEPDRKIDNTDVDMKYLVGPSDVCKKGTVACEQVCGMELKDQSEKAENSEPQTKSLKDSNNEIYRDSDRESGILYESVKRKYNISPVGSHYLRSKSPKGENSIVTSETDNSSDSGISGDLAEESEFQSHKNDYSTPEKNLSIQEATPTVESDYFVSQVHKIFGGKISTSIKCLNCKTESVHKDVFTDINLAFQDSDQCNAASAIRKQPERLCKQKQGENVVDLKIEDMIANFLTSEMLTGENQYECDKCGGKQDAERSIQIIETPEHLILTQLRFFYDTTKGQRQKVFTNVDFGEELLFPYSRKIGNNIGTGDLSPSANNFTTGEVSSLPGNNLAAGEVSPSGNNLANAEVSPYGNNLSNQEFSPSDTIRSITSLSEDNFPSTSNCNVEDRRAEDIAEDNSVCSYDRYALYGVVVHSGFSSEGGHYYCYARNSSLAGLPSSTKESRFEDLGNWFNFNDERVTKTSFCAISRLTKTFTRDTAYLLFYRKVDLSHTSTPQTVPLLEDFSTLRQDLRDAIEAENLQYRSEQEAEALKKRILRSFTTTSSSFPKKDDDDDDEPPPSSGGTCGDGNEFSITSREVF